MSEVEAQEGDLCPSDRLATSRLSRRLCSSSPAGKSLASVGEMMHSSRPPMSVATCRGCRPLHRALDELHRVGALFR
jgi:hypothetical protein